MKIICDECGSEDIKNVTEEERVTMSSYAQRQRVLYNTGMTGRTRIPVQTLRCMSCGYKVSYDPNPPDPVAYYADGK